ncbi:ABC-three component system middle component 6 [Mesorhizobium sp.]|uniref:ABC-three component system middle component 6 n=1 Tax=Mesorhizobium sp. TaxID=1871066 RepID=UPI000FE94896|nr:MAG: hypothetical protein EOR93_04615 [Mesorhizobium sp.]
MILPSKHLPPARSLLAIGGEILSELEEPRAASEVWERVRTARAAKRGFPSLAYDEFILSLTFLHAVWAVEIRDGLIAKSAGRRE